MGESGGLLVGASFGSVVGGLSVREVSKLGVTAFCGARSNAVDVGGSLSAGGGPNAACNSLRKTRLCRMLRALCFTKEAFFGGGNGGGSVISAAGRRLEVCRTDGAKSVMRMPACGTAELRRNGVELDRATLSLFGKLLSRRLTANELLLCGGFTSGSNPRIGSLFCLGDASSGPVLGAGLDPTRGVRVGGGLSRCVDIGLFKRCLRSLLSGRIVTLRGNTVVGGFLPSRMFNVLRGESAISRVGGLGVRMRRGGRGNVVRPLARLRVGRGLTRVFFDSFLGAALFGSLLRRSPRSAMCGSCMSVMGETGKLGTNNFDFCDRVVGPGLNVGRTFARVSMVAVGRRSECSGVSSGRSETSTSNRNRTAIG